MHRAAQQSRCAEDISIWAVVLAEEDTCKLRFSSHAQTSGAPFGGDKAHAGHPK